MRNNVVLGAGLHDARNDIATALDDAEHDCLVVRLVCRVIASDESFVRLNGFAGAAHRRVTINVAHIEADQVAHAPSGLVGHA